MFARMPGFEEMRIFIFSQTTAKKVWNSVSLSSTSIGTWTGLDNGIRTKDNKDCSMGKTDVHPKQTKQDI